ncbi:MAG: hypothetical protein ABI303_02835 [Candidatus Saccharimonas sp.]
MDDQKSVTQDDSTQTNQGSTEATDTNLSDIKQPNGVKPLDQVKKEALQALTPIVDEIKDMDPERKFEICISAIRSTDNKDLAEAALKAALGIEDSTSKAEALVELITEINYLEKA